MQKSELYRKSARLRSLLIGLSIFWLGPLAALAQARPDTASFAISNVKLQNMSGAVVNRPRRLVLVNVQAPRHEQTEVEQYWQDEHLRLRRLSRMNLRGRLELEGVQGAAHHLLLQLLSRDSLVLASVDTAGRLVAQVRQPLVARRQLFEANPLSLPRADVFLTAEKPTRQGSTWLRCRSPSLAMRWEKRFGRDTTLEASAGDSTHLWVLLMADYATRHPVSTAVCLDLATGREQCRVVLTNEQARRIPSVIDIGPGHCLLVAGHAYDGQAAALRHSGDLFFQRISPGGQVLTDYFTDFRHEPSMHGAAAELVQWQLLWPDARGRLQLVGETYTYTSFGQQLATSMLTMGVAGHSTTLRPKDIVHVRLTSDGQVEQLRVVPLRLDYGSFTWPDYVQGRVIASLANKAGEFRVRALADDSTTLVLRSPQQIQALDLPTGELRVIRPAPAKGLADVLYVGDNFVIIGEARPARHTLRMLRVPLPKASH